MELNTLIESFFRARALSGDAPATIQKSRLRLKKHFLNYLEAMGKTTVEDLSSVLIREWQEDLTFKQNPQGIFYAIRFRKLILQTVKNFCKWLYQENYLATDLSLKLESLKDPKTLPRHVLEEKEILAIIQQTDLKTLVGFRDRLMLELFYGTGIRCQEMKNLKLSHVDLEGGYLFIEQGKGSKDRVVPIGKGPMGLLKLYLKEIRPKLLVGHHDALIVSTQKAGPLSESQIERKVGHYAKQAGITKRVYPHLLRHSCATHLIRNGAPIRCVQELLGHSSINSTQIYTHLTITDLKKAHARYHPRERMKREEKKEEKTIEKESGMGR